MNKEIKIKSRYNDIHTLKRLGDEDSKLYELKTEFSYRMGMSDNPNECTFIDPSGGPFITPGFEIEGNKIKTIYANGTIEFE